VLREGPGRRLLSGLSGQRSRISIRDCPRSQPDLNGTSLTVHPVLNGLDRASRPIAPNPSGYSALQSSPRQQPPTGSEPWCKPSGWDAQQGGWCSVPIYPPKTGFCQGRFSGMKIESWWYRMYHQRGPDQAESWLRVARRAG